MSARKKRIIAAVVVFILLAAGAGALVAIPRINRQEVEVYPVSRIREYAWGDAFGSYGNIMAANMQAVQLNSDMLLLSVDVSAGDEVEPGDTLLRYDTTIQDLNINTIRIQNDILKNKIRKAESELTRVNSLVASTPPNPPPEPKNLIMDGSMLTEESMNDLKVSGNGETAGSRLVFNCYYGVVISPDFLRSLYVIGDIDDPDPPDTPDPPDPPPEPEGVPKYVEFRVYYFNNVLMFRWRYDGNVKFDPDSRPNGWELSKGVKVHDDQTISHSGVDRIPGSSFRRLADTVDYYGGPHYSQAEIDRMRNSITNELADYRTQLKMGELELETALAELGDGSVKSLISGIVSEVNDPEYLEAGMPVIVVQSGKGYRVEGTVSELNLHRIKTGQEVTVSSWFTGSSYPAEITEIHDFPSRFPGGSMGMENPLNSFYTFVAMIGTDEVLMVGDWVEIGIEGSNARAPDDSAIYLPNAFIREESGRSFVMKQDSDGLLTRQYVMTGKALYGYATEIRSGITLDDNIAFPYGKAVKEGAPTVVAEGMYW